MVLKKKIPEFFEFILIELESSHPDTPAGFLAVQT